MENELYDCLGCSTVRSVNAQNFSQNYEFEFNTIISNSPATNFKYNINKLKNHSIKKNHENKI
jgi:hypothetical protein